ncbi:MAG: HAMP domain-containing sensor histidine kinase [Planctomycetaceae bacterium]
MITYRSFKRLLGENSLERKCRFLFGGALMLLIAASFYFYAASTLKIVRNQHRQRAQLLISHNLLMAHWKANVESDDSYFIPKPLELEPEELEALSVGLKPETLRDFNWKFIYRDYEEAGTAHRPNGQIEYDAYDALFNQDVEFVFAEEPKEEHSVFFERVVAGTSCLRCHRDGNAEPRASTEGELMAMARVNFDLNQTRREIAGNNGILWAMAIVTGVLAMTAAWAIVRYVIVKPVMHLKDVSDAVAHGDLEQRAEIRTGDEFEELSHAFNRMLRHLVTTQDELRSANTELDGKVDQLAQANLSLHEMNQVKNDFLATMSHELRTPLNSILGFGDVLKMADNLTDKQRKYLGNILSSGQSLLTLINDILDLAKIEAGRMEVNLSAFVPAELVERLVLTMRPLAEKKNIEVQWEVDPSLDVIDQDYGKLRQILFNLLSNAVKFTPEGGRIHISLYPTEDDCFDTVVADTGIGIPLDDQVVIFERFRQAPSSVEKQNLTREYEGTGLGLSIVKELCRLLGGHISLESEFGKGSAFTVHLPRHLPPPEPLLPKLEPELPRLPENGGTLKANDSWQASD